MLSFIFHIECVYDGITTVLRRYYGEIYDTPSAAPAQTVYQRLQRKWTWLPRPRAAGRRASDVLI